MHVLFLPFTPRFITLTLTVLAAIAFGLGLSFDSRSILLAICFGL